MGRIEERMARPGQPDAESFEDFEDYLSAYWAWYYALTFREKLREDGVLGWLTHTNAGVITGVGVAFVVLALLAALLG